MSTVMRAGVQVADRISLEAPVEATRLPFAALAPAGE